MIENWKAFLQEGIDQAMARKIELHGRTGRPLGEKRFIQKLQRKTGRTLAPQRHGPKPLAH
jgi:hypothetical protein